MKKQEKERESEVTVTGLSAIRAHIQIVCECGSAGASGVQGVMGVYCKSYCMKAVADEVKQEESAANVNS